MDQAKFRPGKTRNPVTFFKPVFQVRQIERFAIPPDKHKVVFQQTAVGTIGRVPYQFGIDFLFRASDEKFVAFAVNRREGKDLRVRVVRFGEAVGRVYFYVKV